MKAMTSFRQWFLVGCALVAGSVPSLAAGNAKEERTYAAAVSAFDGRIWNRADTAFAQFIDKYPQSPHIPEAVLLRAQALFKEKKFTETINLLKANQSKAKNFEDQYLYWIGEAQLGNGNFPDAVGTLNSVAQSFPASKIALQATVEASSVLARVGDWPGVTGVLTATNSVFLRDMQAGVTNGLTARGRLLLAQAKFEQKDFNGAVADLEGLDPSALVPELGWQRAYLLCRAKMAVGELPAALVITTNLLRMTEHNDNLRSESVALRGELFEKLNQPDAAIAAYHDNLGTNAPVERRRQAILKIAGLATAQNQYAVAERSLGDYLQQFSNSPPAEVALLTLGELYLKDDATTNHLQDAQLRFDQFLARFPNRPLAGKAYLDRGWCRWLSGQVPESLNDFKAAAQRLPKSEDLAVAQFKMGDALFVQKDYVGALKNYRAVLDNFSDFPEIEKSLGDRALYQSLRANLELKDLAGANRTLEQMLQRFPSSQLAPNSALLYGEGLADSHRPAEARETFHAFETEFPMSSWRPQAELAVARTYELEQDWTNAIAGYEKWIATFPTNEFRPQAAYALAWANYQAGDETNALNLFTNFLGQFPADPTLAPQAQWWIADHYFSAGEFAIAQKNYDLVYEHFPANELAYPARLRAGRAAMGRQGYSEAIRDYFKKLEEDTNCPPDLRVQAMFAHGEALMHWESVDTNNPSANFQLAVQVFDRVRQSAPDASTAALACFLIGECDVQVAHYDAATNAYAQAARSPTVDISTRSKARIGLGIALEKKAAAATGGDQKALLQLAFNNYLDVFDTGVNPPNGEMADAFWVKKAGLQAAALAETLGEWEQARAIYGELKKWLPQLGDSLDKKIASAGAHLADKKD